MLKQMSNPPPQHETNEKYNQNLQALSAVSTNIADSIGEKIKTKKMSSNRRKRQKFKQKQQQAKNCLERIIKKMYSVKATFQEQYENINSLLQVDLDEDRFYEFINKVIREEVDALADEIHNRTARLCQCHRSGQLINPVDVIQFYGLIKTVQQASIEVERIINLFILKVEDVEGEEYLHQNLAVSTTKYIFQSDPSKQDFESFCLAFIEQNKDFKTKNLIQYIFKTFKQSENHVEYNDQNEYLSCNEDQQVQQCKKKKKKKRNKKKQEQQKKQMNLYKEIQYANSVIEGLQEMIISQDDRTECYFEQKWLADLKNRLAQHQ